MLAYRVVGTYGALVDEFDPDERMEKHSYTVKTYFDKDKAEAERDRLNEEQKTYIPSYGYTKTTFTVETIEIE